MNHTTILLVGHGSREDTFDIPMADGSRRSLSGFEPFVTTRGTLYLFYPTRTALDIIATPPAADGPTA